MSNPDWLERAARRSQDEPWMLGHVFERYLQLEGGSREAFAKELGCTREVLHWLSLCRRPEGEAFTEQASAIASRFGVALLPLVQVLRQVEVLDALSTRDVAETVTEEGRMLLAARDHSDDEDEETRS